MNLLFRYSFLLLFLFLLLLHDVAAQARNAQKLYEQAQSLAEAGKFEDALSSLNECLAEAPNNAEAYGVRAYVKEQLGDLAGALTDYSVMLELVPTNFDGRLGRANTFFRLGRFEEAKQDYLALLTADTGETTTVYFSRNASANSTMQITTAQSHFTPAVLNSLGLTEIKLNNPKAAITWLDSAIHLSPREPDYYVNRGLAKRMAHDESAGKDFAKALEINPNHTPALSALAGSKNGDVETEEYLERAVSSDSLALYPLLERAYYRMQKGQLKGSLSDYNQAIKLRPNDPDIWLNRGAVKERLRDLEGAYTDYTQAISLSENYDKAWLNRGNALQKLGRYTEAMEDYSVAITYNPAYAAAFYNRAIVHERLKQMKEACADILQAEKLGLTVDKKLKALVCR
jgi:tetratricopeptide (TPR) repeat protein